MSAAHSVLSTPNLVAFWDFQKSTDGRYTSEGPEPIVLVPQGAALEVVEDGVFGPLAPRFGNGAWLQVKRAALGALNIHGPEAQVTVIAWVKRHASAPGLEKGCQAVAGIWNEHSKRQYCLFLNLTALSGAEQIGGHISSVGGPTPGFRYCMDAALGATPVPFGEWCTIALTYDGACIRSWLNGELDQREALNPYSYPGGIFNGGVEGGDFTVGAVARPERVDFVDGRPVEHGFVQANLFCGLLGGLAIYNRALSAGEMAQFHIGAARAC